MTHDSAPIVNKIISVTLDADWSRSSRHIGYVRCDSLLQVAEWLLINSDNYKMPFTIKELEIIDVTDLDLNFTLSMTKNNTGSYTINQKHNTAKQLELERLKIQALKKLSTEEKQALGLE